MNNRVGRTRRTGLFLSGKPDDIQKELLALQQRYGPDMPLAYVLSLRNWEYTRFIPESHPLQGPAPQAI